MKRIEAIALAIVGIVVMSCGLFFCLNPVRVPLTSTINLGPLGALDGPYAENWQFRHHQNGERVVGYVTVTGGDEEVWFTIEDPNGGVIDYVGIYRRIEFAFTAEYDGAYRFRFSNTQQDSGKTVSLTENVIAPNLILEFWLLVVGAGAFTLALGLIGYFSEKLVQDRKSGTHAIPPPP